MSTQCFNAQTVLGAYDNGPINPDIGGPFVAIANIIINLLFRKYHRALSHSILLIAFLNSFPAKMVNRCVVVHIYALFTSLSKYYCGIFQYREQKPNSCGCSSDPVYYCRPNFPIRRRMLPTTTFRSGDLPFPQNIFLRSQSHNSMPGTASGKLRMT